MSDNWIRACATEDIDDEDLLRFDYGDKTFCIYNTPKGFYATDGMCTHEDEHLEFGMVINTVVECPLHQGRFDILTGEALSAPVCVDLKTYTVKIINGDVYLDVG
ncbi:MAG: 3-phenylpropionate/trans-cinnamate dioxygenase ferredoxin subunit [Candidatus Azotimanducaceae bacterium]|jgi:3-phenylpropionate/trans-cinnamate dioxygenase ferredoxin subunit